jgi:hypothetical protein
MKIRPRFYNGQECALILLRLLQICGEKSPASRVRLSELTLRTLWGRDRIRRELLEDVQDWMSRGGWSLFFAGTTYAAVRTSAVQSWARVSSKRIDINELRDGTFDFDRHLHLLDGDRGIED